MFIAGAYRYAGAGESSMSLRPVVTSISEELLHRNKERYYIEDSAVCFVSNNECKTLSDLILVYAGQFFNMEELKAQLSLANDSTNETALKAAYKRWDSDFISHIAGEFTIALYDKTNHRLLLSRDRAGMKPLYYSQDDSMFIFASEVKALLRMRKKRRINFLSLHSCIVFGSVYSRTHLIEGIYELRAGHNLIINSQSKIPVIHKYWDRVFNITKQPFLFYENEFKRLFSEAVKKRLPPSNVKVGISLSGGVDSTLALGLVKESYSGPIEAYTAIAEGDSSSEYQDARLAAKHFQVKHREIFISAYEAIQSLPKIIWHMSEFSNKYSIIGPSLQTYFVGKLAKENGCSCIFTGNGVEHNFDGNGPQRKLYKFYHNSQKTPKFIRDKFIPLLPSRLKNFLWGNCSYSWPSENINNIEEQYIRFNSVWKKGESYLKKMYAKDLNEAIGAYEAKGILFDYLKECTAQDYFNKLLYLDFKTWNSRRNLVMNERLFGAFGIELQIPFLDADLIQFSSSMPISIKHSFIDKKYFLRKIYKNKKVLPLAIYNKGKYGSLLRFDFRKSATLDIILHFVSELKKRRIFREGFIDRELSRAKRLTKKKMHRCLILGLFELELWFRIFIDHHDIKEENLTLDYLAR